MSDDAAKWIAIAIVVHGILTAPEYAAPIRSIADAIHELARSLREQP